MQMCRVDSFYSLRARHITHSCPLAAISAYIAIGDVYVSFTYRAYSGDGAAGNAGMPGANCASLSVTALQGEAVCATMADMQE